MKFTLFIKIISLILSGLLGILPSSMGIASGELGPKIVFDAENLTGEVTNGASGYLYGMAEEGVPSYNMTESLDISSVSAKTQGGLQHPIGEVGDVAAQLTKDGKCDYIVVYLQDMFPTWYYDHMGITEMKKNGTYDWREYLTDTYFPLVEKTINEMKNSPYADKLVYCIFNECDNGIWFGEWVPTPDGGGWHNFNEVGRQNFNEAWKMTYDKVLSLDANAKIGGPGNFEYNKEKTEAFLSFTSENNCNPHVMIYHELGDRSIYDWEANVDSLKEIEAKYNIPTSTPIILTEYGRMQDNGDPATMAKYIIKTENSKVYSNQAYWLLANNLCNTCADYNTPNSAWWVYRWYTSMQGQTMSHEIKDIFHSDLEKAFKEGREPRYQQFLALGAISENRDKIDVLASGADYNGAVVIKNLKDTKLYRETVKVTVEAITYQSIAGAVTAPEIVKTYTTNCLDRLCINLNMNKESAYHITVEPSEKEASFNNNNLFVRFEAEHGERLGNTYFYDSAYATTGEIQGMVGGMENEGDGIKIPINAPKDGEYLVRVIYGNSNDGVGANGRVDTLVNFSLDGNEAQIISLPNTIKSELTNVYDMKLNLTKGEHTLTFTHNRGTYVLDSVLIKEYETDNTIYCEKDDDRENSLLAIAPCDGYYNLTVAANEAITIDGANIIADENGNSTVYLRRGLNYIDRTAEGDFAITKSDNSHCLALITPDMMTLTNGANIENGKKPTLSGISSEGGKATFTVTAPQKGVYAMTVEYSSNRENGVHSYNVDLVEDFITLKIGDFEKSFYTRSTYSGDSFTTVTVNIELEAGENTVEIINNGYNQFNGNTTYIPNISSIGIYSPSI